jgi:hypothetical protein
MRKKRSFVLFTTVVLGLSAMSFVSVTEAQHRPEARDRPEAPVTNVQPEAEEFGRFAGDRPNVQTSLHPPDGSDPAPYLVDIIGQQGTPIQPLIRR